MIWSERQRDGRYTVAAEQRDNGWLIVCDLDYVPFFPPRVRSSERVYLPPDPFD